VGLAFELHSQKDRTDCKDIEAMVKAKKTFKGGIITITFEIESDHKTDITSPKDLGECFHKLIGYTSSQMPMKTVKKTFNEVYKAWDKFYQAKFFLTKTKK